MAPATSAAVDATATATADVSSLEKKLNRWPDTHKVYTRKFFKKKPKPPADVSPIPPNPHPDPTAAAEATDTPSEPPAIDAAVPDDASSSHQHGGGEADDGKTLRIDLRSRSKHEIRELKKKLVDELEQVRALARRIDADYGCDEQSQHSDSRANPPNYLPMEAEANGNGLDEQSQHSDIRPNPPNSSNYLAMAAEVNGNGLDEQSRHSDSRPNPPNSSDYLAKAAEANGNGLDEHSDSRPNPLNSSNYLAMTGQADGNRLDEQSQHSDTRPYPPNSSNYLAMPAEANRNRLDEHSDSRPNSSNYLAMAAEANGNGLFERFDKENCMPKVANLNSLSRPSSALSFQHLTVDTKNSAISGLEKEKRTPKANQYYKNPDFVLIGKDYKFPPPEQVSHKKLKPNGNSNSFLEKKYAHAFKSCTALLSRLMKHRHSWVFNSPVDVKGLGLHDYYIIISHPMDLGTVKTRLNRNWYKSPREFAEDVRLTFRNAMTYNPKGQDVHIMAEQLLQIFEEKWPSIEAEYSYISYPSTPVARKPPQAEVRMFERSNSMVHPITVEPRTKTKSINHTNSIGRHSILKQPKPKAKDLYKREMTLEEKQKLGANLQNLPPEKLEGVLQIIKRSNSSLCQQEDEIEVDIDSVDTETLWELDRFVTNYKKSLSKYKRKAELAMLARAEAERRRGQERVVEGDVVGGPRQNHSAVNGKEVSSSFPAGGENKRENASGSSSSSSSSSDSGSSSSDSDSDSSSGNESDVGH